MIQVVLSSGASGGDGGYSELISISTATDGTVTIGFAYVEGGFFIPTSGRTLLRVFLKFCMPACVFNFPTINNIEVIQTPLLVGVLVASCSSRDRSQHLNS